MYISLSATNTLLYTCRADHEFAYNYCIYTLVYTFTHTAHTCILLHSIYITVHTTAQSTPKVHSESEMCH